MAALRGQVQAPGTAQARPNCCRPRLAMQMRARFVMYALSTGFTYVNYMTWCG
jgi:hypothetical protein